MSYWNVKSTLSTEFGSVPKGPYNDREHFVRENPNMAAEQDREGNKKIGRFIVIVSISVASVIGVHHMTNTGFSPDTPKTPMVKNKK